MDSIGWVRVALLLQNLNNSDVMPVGHIETHRKVISRSGLSCAAARPGTDDQLLQNSCPQAIKAFVGLRFASTDTSNNTELAIPPQLLLRGKPMWD